MARLRSGETCYALVCNHKGKIEADVFIRAADDAFFIDAPGELRESLLARLGKYLIADDCELEDVTGAFALWHELDPAGTIEVAAASVNRFGRPGRDTWARLPAEVPAATLGGAALDLLRLEHAIPVWGAELTPNTLPQEARVQDRAVDFFKGCYIGQEVISRLKSVGHVTRELRALETTAGRGPAPAWRWSVRGPGARRGRPGDLRGLASRTGKNHCSRICEEHLGEERHSVSRGEGQKRPFQRGHVSEH